MHDSSSCMSEVYLALCRDVDTPISLSAWLRYKYSHKELLGLDLPVRDYLESDLNRFKGDYAVSTFLSKWKGLKAEVDLEAVALEKFVTSETACRETNRRLRAERSAPTDGVMSARLFRAKQKIARLLGPFSLHSVSTGFGWGPGATHDIPRARAQVDIKLATVPITVGGQACEVLASEITLDLHWSATILGAIPEGPWSWLPGVFERVDTCRVTTVPKSAKTHRTIAIEPTGNLFLQKGVGGYIRSRLRRVGIDLDNQGVNQNYAAKALELDLATIDLKAASDTVCRELVYELLPLDWAFYLDAIRSPSALMPDGSVVRLEKWSSMGNGYTFELETLIFWALGSSVNEEMSPGGVLSVYGDDIICTKAAAAEVVRTLAFVGFTTNDDKSFVDGLFYESCGKHYFNGHDVTPLYQKETFANPVELIRCHNRLVRWADRVSLETRAHFPLLRYSPDELRRCLLPPGVEGDDGFICSLEDFLRNSRGFSHHHGWLTRVVKSSVRSFPGIERALLALALRQSHNDVDSRGGVFRFQPFGASEKTMEGRASYGNVEIGEPRSKPGMTEQELWEWHLSRVQFSERWIVPPGYCPLPRR